MGKVATTFGLCIYPFLSISVANALVGGPNTYSGDHKIPDCSLHLLYLLVLLGHTTFYNTSPPHCSNASVDHYCLWNQIQISEPKVQGLLRVDFNSLFYHCSP